MRLIAEGLTPLEVKSGTMSLADRLNQPVNLGRRLGVTEQSLVLTQLAMLVRSGLPVDRSLDLLREQSPRAMQRELLAQALSSVRAGNGLARAFEQQGIFPDYVVGVLYAAERSGKLGDALGSLADRMGAVAETRRQLATALTYPIAVLAATLLALTLVLVLVVPQFEPVFAGQEARLPSLTRAVLALSNLVTDQGAALVLGLGIVAGIVFLLLRTERAGMLVERHRHHIPGAALRDQYLAAQFTGLLGTLIGNGVPAVKALPLARGAIGSQRWRRHIEWVERRVREGSTLSGALGAGSFVPSTAVRLIEVGERSGSLAETCRQASQIMASAARARIERIVSLVNPMAIIVLGGLVAMLVAGVMLGIFALGDFAG